MKTSNNNKNNLNDLNDNNSSLEDEKSIAIEKEVRAKMRILYIFLFLFFMAPLAIFAIFMVPPKKESNKYILLVVFSIKLVIDILFIMIIIFVFGTSYGGWDILTTFIKSSYKFILFFFIMGLFSIFQARKNFLKFKLNKKK